MDILNDVPQYEAWVRQQLVHTVEAGFRQKLRMADDEPLNYFYSVCITSSGKCERNHRMVWCGGMTTVQVVRKLQQLGAHFVLYVTKLPNKGAAVRHLEAYDNSVADPSLWHQTFWVGDGHSERMYCCDRVWGWLFNHVLEKKAK
jgi:hypothetical protein